MPLVSVLFYSRSSFVGRRMMRNGLFQIYFDFKLQRVKTTVKSFHKFLHRCRIVDRREIVFLVDLKYNSPNIMSDIK